MSNWTAWDWIAYGCLGIAAFGLAIGAIWRENPAMFENWPPFLSSPNWSFVPAALVVLGTVVLVSRAIFVDQNPNHERPANVSNVKYEIPSPAKIPTRLRLQFSGGKALPLIVDEQNIWRWYSIATLITTIPLTGAPPEERIPIWTIFITFDKPVNFKQIRIDGGGTQLPRFEVKDSGPRHAIIVFMGDVPASIIEISTIL